MDRLDDLLLEWEAGKDSGKPVGPDALCPDDPGAARRLADRIRSIEACDRFLDLTPLPSDSRPTAPTPRRVGKYEVRRVIGQGGMGVVYEAWDPALRRRVAVKMIHPRMLAAAGRESDARFAREGQALARLDHPNIVAVYEAAVDEAGPYLVMKYVPGGSLAAHRDRLAAAGPAAIVPLMEKVARAVHAAHEQGVLHRDLKPGNVLLTETHEPLVADFGLARLRDPLPPETASPEPETRSEVSAVTDPGAEPGTLPYMAPEQLTPGDGPLGPQTDVWALGVILYELVTGKRPFDGADRRTLAGQVRSAPDFAAFRGRKGRSLAAVIARCLRVRPDRQYRSAGELADELKRLGKPTRRAVLWGAVAGCGVLAAGIPLGVAALDPDRRYRWRTQATLRALREGRTVELVRPGGPLPPYRLLAGGGSTQVGADGDGLVVRSAAFGLVELLPELPAGGCRIEVELRHDNSEFKPGGPGCLGVFFGAARVEMGGLIHHFLGYVMFDEFEPQPGVGLGTVWYSEPAPGSDAVARPYRNAFPKNGTRAFPAAIASPKPVRTLVLTTDPAQTRLTWVGEPGFELGPLRATDIERYAGQIDRTEPGLGAAFQAGYAARFGVFVAGGRMTVHRLQVTPLGAG